MNKEILRLAIPNILSNISVPLLSSVDTALMGRLSAAHIGAVGLGAMIFNLVYWNFGFLRMGTTGLTAQAYGADDSAETGFTLGRALFLAGSLAGLILLLQIPLAKLSFFLLNVPTGQIELVGDYFFIRVWAAPATLGLYVIMGWFFGLQNAVYPLVLTLLVNGVNIVLSYWLVQVMGWEVRGVAWGTLIAQYLGFSAGVGLILVRYRSAAGWAIQKAVLAKEAFLKFLRLNSDIFIRTLCLTLAFGFFYSQSATYGELILAANVILLQFLNWMSYGVDGFAFATESLVGKYAGKKDDSATRKAIALAFGWGMGLALGYALLYGFGGKALLWLFTNQQEVVDATLPFLVWMVLFPLLSTPCYLWDGVFIGLTASRSMRNSMLVAVLFFVVAYLLLANRFENHGLWAALLIFMIGRGLIQQLLFLKFGTRLR